MTSPTTAEEYGRSYVPARVWTIVNPSPGDDDPFLRYRLTLAPGQTAVIMNFATGQATKAAAGTKASALANQAMSAVSQL